MTADEMRAMANGLMPVLIRAVTDARAKDIATIKALEERILELETKPPTLAVDNRERDYEPAISELITAIETEVKRQL